MTLDRLSVWWGGVRRVRGSVVLRLLATVLAFSCAITLILTAFQLYRDYELGLEQIQNRLVDIDRSYRDSLGEALWRLDEPQLKLELDGMLRLADIRAAEVRESVRAATPLVVKAGQRMPGMTVVREFPLVYRVQGHEQQIGTLYVEATLSNLYHDLTRTAFVILASQAANTFLAALFTFYIFSRLVTRHLATIARTVGDYDFHEPQHPLSLQRTPPKEPDELERVVTAFNAMGTRLHRAYLDEREAHTEREARRVAEAANRAKGEFLANLSHELRTPLNGILGYAQILRRDGTLSGRQRDGVAVIQQSGEHLLTLIDETLDFAKLEAGKLRFEIGEVRLADLVDTIREVIGVKAEQRLLALRCSIAADAPPGVLADERRLRQVLLNLLSNAVKFTDEGGISLRIRPNGDGAVRFEVRDTGIGIRADHHETIFRPFEQAGGSERRAGGTGLGLAISRQFVRAMGGELRVESEVGKGSLFWFDLPPAFAVSPVARAALPVSIVSGYEGPRRKVLVIDDVPVNRTIIVQLLARIGFDTVEAEDGLVGIARMQQEHPDLILTDILMRGIDGLEVTRRIRAMPMFARVPIIAVSASPFGVDGAKSIEAGANAFISKPVDFDALLAKIALLLRLDWTYQRTCENGQQETSLDPLVGPVVALPPEVMDELHRLARDGNMHGIALWAERFAAADPPLAPFAARLYQLAKGYQSKAILQLVERCLQGDTAS